MTEGVWVAVAIDEPSIVEMILVEGIALWRETADVCPWMTGCSG